jgi:hypothetical protein
MRTKKFISLVASLGLALLGVVPMAAGAEGEESETTAASAPAKTFTFDKYLVMEKDANVPNVSFSFEVRPATADEISPAEKNVRPGLDGIKFMEGTDITVDDSEEAKSKSAAVSFKSGDTQLTEISASKDDTIDFLTPDKEDEVYACKKLSLDLDGIPFTDPGVYRYIITETAAGNVAGVSPDANATRDLDIYVMRDTSGASETDSFIVEGFVFYYTSDKVNKSTGFTNQYVTNNLAVAKSVTGNQGSKNKHFKITVKLTNPDGLSISDEDKFDIIGNLEKEPEGNGVTSYTAEEMSKNNVAELSYKQLSEGYSFYLCSGHEFEIKGIPAGLGYEITECQESYSPSVEYSTGSDNMTKDKDGEGEAIEGVKSDETFSVSDSYLSGDTSILFKNDLAGTIPTGILNTIAGSLGIVALGIAGIAGGVVLLKKKNAGEDSES